MSLTDLSTDELREKKLNIREIRYCVLQKRLCWYSYVISLANGSYLIKCQVLSGNKEKKGTKRYGTRTVYLEGDDKNL